MTSKPDIAIIGTGYVGLTTAACLAHLGHRVIAIDVDEDKIRALNRGEVTIVESRLEELVRNGLDSDRLAFSTSYDDVSPAPIVMLCLPTPVDPDNGLDLSFIEGAAFRLGRILDSDAIVVTKSTVPVGTHALLGGWLNRDDLHVASNPEFLREGTAVSDFLAPDRVVVGADSSEVADRVLRLYADLDTQVQVTDPASAELIKYAANSFLALKLSFVNEISRLCDRVGGDIMEVTSGLASDHRIGGAFLRPGPGWGGSCFPKDTVGLARLAESAGLDLPVAKAARHSNSLHFDHITTEIAETCPRPLDQATIAVWGATFKGGTSDTRESPALEIVRRLVALGSTVTVYDPAAVPSEIPVASVGDPYSACVDADLLVVLTDWAEFGEADLDKVAGTMAGSAIYDARYLVDSRAAVGAGLTVTHPGRPATS